MFEQKSKNVEGPGTIVGANVKLSGTLNDINDITVHGQVEGEVISEKNVVVEQTAKVKGPIRAKLITVAGKVNGEIQAFEKLEILETGEVKGSITTNDLIIKSGAVFNGKSRMKQEENEKKEVQKNKSKISKENETKKPEESKDKTDKKYEIE